MARFAIGMDVHKNTCSAHMVCADYGKDSEKIRKYIDGFNERFGYFPTRADEFVEFARVVKEDNCYVLIENSTKSHDVYWMLRNLDVDVTVAHSTDLYRITKSVTKNDANDARELAGYMRRKLNGEVEFAESFIPSPEWMRNRKLCRFLANDKLDLQTVKKQIRAYLLLHGIRTRKEYSDITSVRAMKELREIGDPVLLLYVNKAEELKKRISFTEKTILSRFSRYRMFQIIYSITGAGVMTAAYLTSMIADISRFDNKKSFSASFGLTPKMYSSGESNPNCGISRRGDELSRRLIYQMAFVHCRFEEDSLITQKYKRLKSNGKKHNPALVAASNSLMHVIYSMLRSDTEYISDPEKLREAREKADSVSESEISISDMEDKEN